MHVAAGGVNAKGLPRQPPKHPDIHRCNPPALRPPTPRLALALGMQLYSRLDAMIDIYKVYKVRAESRDAVGCSPEAKQELEQQGCSLQMRSR